MFAQLLGAVRSDVDGFGVLASAGALAALGAIVVGLVALHYCLALFGPFAAYGMVGGSLLLLALILFTFAFVRRRPLVASPPPLQIAQPAALIGTLQQGGHGEAISIGARALSAATTALRDGDRKAMYGALPLGAVVGLVASRRLR